MEVWKDIPGYEGHYQASTMGRIKSIPHRVRGKNPYTGKQFYRMVRGAILKPGRYCKAGHLSVVLGRGTAGKPVHQLIMRTFVGEPPIGMEVLHNNGDPTDNRLSNLRYGTRTDNILDVYTQGGKVAEVNYGRCQEYTLSIILWYFRSRIGQIISCFSSHNQ